jgi:pimeloyl-ACP methyl ester carboxylesterase
MKFYEESFERASAVFDADVAATVKALFRAGDPAERGKPALTSMVRPANGWLGGVDAIPDMPHDPTVVTEADVAAYAAALGRNGFTGPDSWYVNHAANAAYTKRAPGDGRLRMPVLFLDARYDFVCETVDSRLAGSMVALCPDLTRHAVASGHWMAQERPREVNAALAKWLATKAGSWSYGY